jgi:serine-type D-Ala-D-Ala carboxypeptidase (penicillin-binding protein 5/6)
LYGNFGRFVIISVRVCLAICIILGLVVFSAGIPKHVAADSSEPTVGTSPAQDSVNPDEYVPPLEISYSGQAAAVIESSRQRLLFNDQASEKINIPAASKLMTALIACERLPLETPVTISKVVETAEAFEDTPDHITLKSGDKYSVEYLLLRLLFYDSDAAALAIAEQIGGDEAKFADLMNARAGSMELENTVFVNCTGHPSFTSESNKSDGAGTENVLVMKQYTTPLELAKMVSYAMQNQTFARYLKMKSKYLLLASKSLVTMSNAMERIWTLSEGSISGAFYSEQDKLSYIVAVGLVKETNVVIVAAAGRPGSRLSDLQEIVRACGDYYEVTALVEAGERFSGEKEKTVDGESFDLVYKATVRYIHPVGDLFLKSTIRYNSYGPFSRPIFYGLTAGQVIFELNDGTIIAADVAPARQILSKSSLLDNFLADLQNNQNLSTVILVACGMLLFILLIQVLRSLRSLFYLISLIVLERRSRR